MGSRYVSTPTAKGEGLLTFTLLLLSRRWLQYDVKKIEEVVYDISLRGLIPPGQDMGGQGLAFAVSHTECAALVDRLASDPAVPARDDAMQT